MKTSLFNTLGAAAAMTLAVACGGLGDPRIGVLVNGSPIAFSGTQPVEVQGSVLVPLRGVFEALGATVDYDSSTRTITANKGATDVVLQLASTIASVNGQTQMLSQPAQVIGGSTMVPLRFVAQALGAYVAWDAPSYTVEIQTQEPHLATLPQPAGPTESIGRVTGVYTNTNPEQITIRADGQNTSIPISTSTIVLSSDPGHAAVQVSLNDINIGDQVTVETDANGVAQSITATHGEVRGSVKSIGTLANGDSAITLNDGTTVEISPNAPITMNGNPISLSDIMPDEWISVRTNPENSLGYAVDLVNGGKPNRDNGDANRQGGGGDVQITSFTDDATRAMRSGDVITATLVGTPGGQASFSIPGVVDSVPMTETSPGNYSGTYAVPQNVIVSGAAVFGKLARNGASAPLVQASGTLTVDSANPTVTDVSPGRDAVVDSDRPAIYGTLSDSGGSGIDPDKTRISVDGTDVTSQAAVTPSFFSYKPNSSLGGGQHDVRVRIVDRSGNEANEHWSFTISSNRRVRSFTTDAAPGAPLTDGSTVHFDLEAQPGGHADVSVGGIAADLPLRESSPGRYTGGYTISRGDRARNAPVTATFVGPDGATETATLSSGLDVDAGTPDSPRIVSPKDGDSVNDPLVVEGRSAPNSTVVVRVDYVSKELGGLFAISGSAGSQEIKADDHGRWVSDNFSLNSDSLLGNGRNTVYTITAVSQNSNGDKSDPTTVSVKRN